MRIFYFITILLFFSSETKSQSAPTPSEPTAQNKILIDSLMQVSNYKEYFENFCTRQIDKTAKAKNWSPEQANQRKNKIDFDNFKRYTIYNSFSILSKDELLQLIEIVSKLNNKHKGSNIFISNEGIQISLQIFVQNYLF